MSLEILDNGVARSKDHRYPSPGTVTAYVISLKLGTP